MLMTIEGLQQTKVKVKEEQEKDFELIKGLDMESQASGQGKVEIQVVKMQKAFSDYVDKMT